MKGTLLLALCATVFVLAGIEVARAATFTVNSIDDVDDGVCNGAHCSLREALNAANANGNAPVIDTVGFNLSPGTHTISPLTALPVITDSLKIIGNFLLTKPTIELDGSGIAGAANGLHLLGDNNQIIGLVINGFNGDGVHISGTSFGNLVHKNLIGTDLTGTVALGNSGSGVRIFSSSNEVSENTLSGNFEGVRLSGLGAVENLVHDNFIGTSRWSGGDLGNTNAGILIANGASVNFIGSLPFVTGIEGNIIAYNGGAGIAVDSASTENGILSNSIFRNVGLGIDLGNDGVTANDSGDPDAGANNLQNFPEVTSVTFDLGTQSTTIDGTLNSTPNANFLLQFFSTPFRDPSGNGEGRILIGETNVTTDGSGDAIFSVTFSVPLPPCVTATATEDGISLTTSEFSPIFGPIGDADSNGILDVVQIFAPPNIISDVGLGGTTVAGIPSRGPGDGLKVWDALNPVGVHIAFDPDAPMGIPFPPSYSFSMCGGTAGFSVVPGEFLTATCSGGTIGVIDGGEDGAVPVGFTATDGRIAEAILHAGNTLIFDADNFSFTVPPTNTRAVVILVDGEPFQYFVEVDIKPGDDPNSINPASRGVIPVAILSSESFDPTTIDPTTVTLATAAIRRRRNGSPVFSRQDLNGDRILDLVVQVETEDLALSRGNTEAVLEGMTFGGIPFQGSDTVRIVAP